MAVVDSPYQNDDLLEVSSGIILEVNSSEGLSVGKKADNSTTGENPYNE